MARCLFFSTPIVHGEVTNFYYSIQKYSVAYIFKKILYIAVLDSQPPIKLDRGRNAAFLISTLDSDYVRKLTRRSESTLITLYN